MSRNVFLIQTPLQALNAIEAAYAFGFEPSDAVVICAESPLEINNRQTARMLADEKWGAVHVIPHHGVTLSDWLGRMRSLNSVARDLPDCEHVFLGDYGFDLARHFCFRVQPHRVVLLDDGNATLNVARTRVNPLEAKYFLNPPFTTRRKVRLKRLLGMRDHLADHLTYFTVYDLHAERGDRIVNNTYERLRARSTLEVDENTVFFLGTTTAEAEGVGDDRYLEIVSRALTYLGNFANVYYLPHRREDPLRLARLERELGVSVKQFDAPVEYGLCSLSDRLPALVAGFPTSAFVNLQVLFGDRIRLKVFPIELTDSFSLAVFSEVYAYYRRHCEAPQFEIVSDF